MIDFVVLDAGVLGLVANPKPNPAIKTWLDELEAAGIQVCVPEIADYEVRRELLRAGKSHSVQRLDAVGEELL